VLYFFFFFFYWKNDEMNFSLNLCRTHVNIQIHLILIGESLEILWSTKCSDIFIQIRVEMPNLFS
jgi:hypothetical protein